MRLKLFFYRRPQYRLLLILLLLPVLTDQLTGFIQKELAIDFSLSQVVKSFYTLFFMAYLFMKNTKYSIIILIFVCFYLLHFSVNYFIAPDRLKLLIGDISFYAKLLTFPLSFLVFQEISKSDPEGISYLFLKAQVIVFIMLLIAIVMSVFGFGDINYGLSESSDSAFGYKGYFIAGNELSALYIVAYSYWLYFCYARFRNIFILLAGILCGGILAGLIVTKTVLASFAVITVVLPLMMGASMSLYKKSYYYLLAYLVKMSKLLLLLLGVIIAFVITVFSDRINENLNRLEGNLEMADNFNSFLLSGRDQRFRESVKLFTEKYSIAEQLVGTGWEYPQIVIQGEFLGLGSTEVDYMDLLVSYGILGLALFYSCWLAILFLLIRAIIIYRNPMLVPAFFSFLLLLLNSFISGHILYSALAGFYVAIMPPLFGRGKITQLSPNAI